MTGARCRQCAEQIAATARFCPFCGASARASKLMVDPLVGRTIAGSYLILELTGVGGMGRVYRAEQTALGRAVAIKVIHPTLLATQEVAGRFYVEARAASRLNHPNSVSIIDFGRTDDGIVYLVMEFLRGQSLSQLSAKEGLLPVARVCHIMLDVLAALGEAHANGVVHRDLKPENVMIEPLKSGGDLVKVVDFGIAKFADGQSTSNTSPGFVCGTPEYMSPEQGSGQAVDGRSDVYSAGVLLFELLTGHVPFSASEAADVMLSHCHDPIPSPGSIAPGRSIPPPLSAITMRALAKRPDARFQTVAEMAESLREVAQQLRVRSSRAVCASCGRRAQANQQICGLCGAMLQDSITPARASMPPASSAEAVRFIGRTEELERIEALRARAGASAAVLVNLVGEVGTGRSALLAELARRAAGAGDLVLVAQPHDSGAQVPYFAVRTLFSALAAAAGMQIDALVEAGRPGDRMALAGLREVLDPRGVGSRAGAVAHAFAGALQAVLARGPGPRRALVAIDDLHRCDELTSLVLRELPSHLPQTPALLVGVTSSPSQALLARGAEILSLEGLLATEARVLLGEPTRRAADSGEARAPAQRFLPLYVEQLRWLGLTLADTRPARLDEVVTLRIQRLGAPAQRMLQAAAVLGQRSSRGEWLALVAPTDMEGGDELRASGLIVERGEFVELAHPFIRDLVESAIPAVARRELYARALASAVAAGAALEVRAEHAYRGAELEVALALLAEVGHAAHLRGDPHAAGTAHQRALELLRRDAFASADETTWHAMAQVSRDLAEALAAQDDLMGADGVLREGLEYCHARDEIRARLLVDLADVLRKRQRTRDAARVVAQAMEIATAQGDKLCQARAHMVCAALRKAECDEPAALAALTSAHALLADAGAPEAELAAVTLDLAAAMLGANDASGALLAVASAESTAAVAAAPSLGVRAKLLRAQAAQHLGRRDAALGHYDEALALAAEAGDLALSGRVQLAREQCARMPVRQSLRSAS